MSRNILIIFYSISLLIPAAVITYSLLQLFRPLDFPAYNCTNIACGIAWGIGASLVKGFKELFIFLFITISLIVMAVQLPFYLIIIYKKNMLNNQFFRMSALFFLLLPYVILLIIWLVPILGNMTK